jgi:hypothetical protein
MNRQNINLISATASIIFALQAFIVVLLGITTGWDRGLADEGPAAHIFQLLIVAQVPCVLIFLATADWKRRKQVAPPLAALAAILVITFATGRYFNM